MMYTNHSLYNKGRLCRAIRTSDFGFFASSLPPDVFCEPSRRLLLLAPLVVLVTVVTCAVTLDAVEWTFGLTSVLISVLTAVRYVRWRRHSNSVSMNWFVSANICLTVNVNFVKRLPSKQQLRWQRTRESPQLIESSHVCTFQVAGMLNVLVTTHLTSFDVPQGRVPVKKIALQVF